MTSPIETEDGAEPVVVHGGQVATAKPEAGPLVGRSPGQLMWLRFKRDRSGVISAYVVGFFFLIGAVAPLIAKLYGKNPYTVYADERPELFDSSRRAAPAQRRYQQRVLVRSGTGQRLRRVHQADLRHPDLADDLRGGDRHGRADRHPAGNHRFYYIGGKVDYGISRVIDFLLAFPSQLFFIASMPVVVSLFVSPRDETPTYVRVLALIAVQWALGWMSLARILRGTALALREREFIEAAKVSGASPWRIIRKEVLPNVVTPLLVQATYLLPNFVTIEAGLSFLGVGIVEPTPDWGQMFSKASTELVLQNDITYMFFPGVSMIIFVVAFNLLGDSVRDAFDPKTAR